jgi:hypothetical protein
LLGGYGVTHPGLGSTEEYVETAELVLRYGRFLTDVTGRSWYRGRHELLVEVPVHMVVEPDQAPMAGVNFLACWTFTSPKRLHPYIFAGGGLLYTEADIPGMGSNLNGNYQYGLGLHYRPVNAGRAYHVNIEYRFHHISNADTEEPNVPLNGSKLLVGLTFFH